MENIFVVTEEEANRARRFEERLASLPKDSGVLFVGVSVEQVKNAPTREVIYKFYLGVDRSMEERMYMYLVASVLAKEINEYHLNFDVETHRGISRRELGSRLTA